MAYLVEMNRFQTRITSLEERMQNDNHIRFENALGDWQKTT